jgi:hypothetical protein
MGMDPKTRSELVDQIVVTIEDLRAKLSIARCQICNDHLGRDPLNPPAVFERELVHQGCAEKASLGSPEVQQAV